MFKIGDKVKVINNQGFGSRPVGYIGVITQINMHDSKGIAYLDNGNGAYFSEIELINNKMDIKEKFQLAFKNEPEKSFRKAGITNGDDYLTDDGQKIFLSWLLKRNGDDFKKEVVDDLLAEEK